VHAPVSPTLSERSRMADPIALRRKKSLLVELSEWLGV
jgi:hypothetical protein